MPLRLLTRVKSPNEPQWDVSACDASKEVDDAIEIAEKIAI